MEDLIQRTSVFKALTDEQLNFRIHESSWSILECLEHLNRYGNFYIPEIRKQILNSKSTPDKNFKSGLLGGYFANSMLPKEKLNKMKTLASMNPIGSKLNHEVIDIFINQQKKILELLFLAKQVSLNKTRCSISIATWIKLKLGDIFSIVINHNLRHVVQAENVMKGQIK
ncbi:DinB family protein [Robertkochia solimangrovi]|uniref:DinB family protein n=1 Tax=Robertkochia solimangrovi TaxID=2213046 RepID=UPI001F54D474|nr:DinB family protein [Robertkochia solimangrovi]